jgi:hypothetical protein
MNFQAQIIEELSKKDEDKSNTKCRIKDQDLKCNVCGKEYENVNNLKVSYKK